MLIPPLDPPPPPSSYCDRHRLYVCVMFFLDYWGCLDRGETDLVKLSVKFDQNKAKDGQPKFDILKVSGLILMQWSNKSVNI